MSLTLSPTPYLRVFPDSPPVLLVTQPSDAAEMAKDNEAIAALATAFDKAMNANDATALSSVFMRTRILTNY